MRDKIILTLDVGGTNFAFCAHNSNGAVCEYIIKQSDTNNLDQCLETLVSGFKQVLNTVKRADAISFSFPGPADYERGIIHNEGNLSAFKEPIALKDYLEQIFNIPVYINNDGDLFALGEYHYGFLSDLNAKLASKKINKSFKSLVALTLGTGYGGGAILDSKLYRGDNSSAMEVWLSRSYLNQECFLEENISKRAIVNYYEDNSLTPQDIYEIANGSKPGDQDKAFKAFKLFGSALGESIADLITIFDAPIVIGGGLCGASSLFMPSVLDAINSKISTKNGELRSRLVSKVYCADELDNLNSMPLAIAKIPDSENTVEFHSEKFSVIGVSSRPAYVSICYGAYIWAREQLDKLTCQDI